MQYDFNLVAGGGATLDVAGKFFKYKSGLGAIRVRDSKGGYVDLLPGQGVWNREFTSLTVSDLSGAANSGVLLAGDFDFKDDRIVGDVSVIDNSKNAVLSGESFLRGRAQGAVAGQYGWIQLINPVGSGLNVAIKRIQISADTAQIMSLGETTADANLNTAYPRNKNIGGANGIMKTNTGTNAAAVDPALGVFTTFGSLIVGALSGVELPITTPIILLPGRSVAIVAGIVNCTIYALLDCEQF